MTHLFEFILTNDEFHFLIMRAPPQLKQICLEASSASESTKRMVVTLDHADDLFEFCMDFVVKEGFDADYEINALGRLAEDLGDKFFMRGGNLFFCEFDRLKNLIHVSEIFKNKICAYPDLESRIFYLTIDTGALLYDLCLEKLSEAKTKEDASFLKKLMHRFFVRNRVK